jgi:hypothetical protein
MALFSRSFNLSLTLTTGFFDTGIYNTSLSDLVYRNVYEFYIVK